MKFRTTVILFVAFVALLILVFFFENREKGKKDEEEKLVSLSADNVEKISLKKEGQSTTFEKDEKGEWLIKEPLEARADKYEVDQLAGDFSELRIERVVEEAPSDLEKYGIPQKEITLWLKDTEKPVKVLIGMENPLDSTFFAKRDDEARVVLVPSHLKSILEKTLFDFRQKDVFKFETNDVKSVKLRANKIEWEAQKKDEEWFFQKPVEALAEKSKIESLLSSLSGLKAKEFISEEKKEEDVKKYGLDQPEYKVSLSLPAQNQEMTFFLHKEDDKLYATSSLSSKIITSEDSFLSDLEKEVKELREKDVADFYSWEVNKLHIKKGGLDLTLAKDEKDIWLFEPQAKEEADKEKIQAFIRKIEGLEASEFIDPPLNLKDFGLDPPQAEVKVWTKEDKDKVKEVAVFIGAEDKEAKKVVVKNARFDYLFRIDSGFLEDFPKDASDWKKQEEKKEEKKKENSPF